MDSTSPAAAIIAACQDTIDNPQYYVMRGGDDADTWPGSAVSCAFAYRIMQRMDYLQQAIMYLQASLSDDQTLGDGMACAPGVSTNWQAWAAAQDCTAPPPILQTITHDTGYPMRWYGPDVALAYDWLNGAPGVSAALLSQTVTCLTAWLDYYSQYGYHNTEAGAELQCRLRHCGSARCRGHRKRRRCRRSPLDARHRRRVRAAARRDRARRLGYSGRGCACWRDGRRRLARGLAVRTAQRPRSTPWRRALSRPSDSRSQRWIRGPTVSSSATSTEPGTDDGWAMGRG